MSAHFTISDSESEASEEVEEGDNNQSLAVQEPQLPQRHSLTLPELRLAGRKAQRIVGKGGNEKHNRKLGNSAAEVS